jgi:hypothetical protein
MVSGKLKLEEKNTILNLEDQRCDVSLADKASIRSLGENVQKN